MTIFAAVTIPVAILLGYMIGLAHGVRDHRREIDALVRALEER